MSRWFWYYWWKSRQNNNRVSFKHDLILILRVRNVSKRLLPMFPIACVSCIFERRIKFVYAINNPLVQTTHVQQLMLYICGIFCQLIRWNILRCCFQNKYIFILFVNRNSKCNTRRYKYMTCKETVIWQ